MTIREWLDKNFSQIKKIYPGARTVYGPYNNSKDGRTRVVIYDGSARISRQFCRVKMEVKLKRRLSDDETVDHDDGNILNDDYKNLVVRPRAIHASLDVLRRKPVQMVCPECSEKFTLTLAQRNSKKHKAGPFCSRACTGKYGARVQNSGMRLKRNEVSKEYYTLKEGTLHVKGLSA